MKILIWLHVASALVALITMFVPLFSKKGGSIHRRLGIIYVQSMLVTCGTAIVVSLWRIFGEPNATDDRIAVAAFMIFLSLFALSGISHGLMALKFKERKEAVFDKRVLALPFFVFILGLVAMVGGYLIGKSVLLWFPLVGVIVSAGQIKYWISIPQEKMHWWYEHMAGMFTACISTSTAFVVVALPRLIENPTWVRSLYVWLAPSLVLVPILLVWTNRYKHRFEAVK